MRVFITTFTATVLIALVIGYFSLSLRISNAMVETVFNISTKFKDKGIIFDYSLSREKASFFPAISLNNIRISFLDSEKITAIEIGKAEVVFDFFSDHPLKILFDKDIKFITYEDEYTLTFARADIGVSFFKKFILKDISIKSSGVSLAKNFETEFLSKNFSLNFKKNLEREGISIELDANGIDIFKENFDGIFINAFLNKEINISKDLNEIIARYRDKGGVISILKGALAKDDLKIAFDGSVIFDEEELPYIVLISSIYNFDYGLSLLEERGVISQKEHWLSKVVLFGLAKKDDNNESYIPADIVVKKGKVHVGPILFYDFKGKR